MYCPNTSQEKVGTAILISKSEQKKNARDREVHVILIEISVN